MENDGVVIRVAGSTIFVVVGVVADVSAVVLLALSDDIRNAASTSPLVMIAISGALTLLSLVLLNLYSRTRSLLRERESEIDSLKRRLATANAADVRRWADFWDDFGRDAPLYRWLRETFFVSNAREVEVDELVRVERKWSRDPSRYYDDAVQNAFVPLREALSKLDEVTSQNYWYEREPDVPIGQRRLSIPPEWDHKRRDAAIKAISAEWDAVMLAYEEFVKVCYDKGIAGSLKEQ